MSDNKYYSVKTKREVEQPNGKIKKVGEQYLVLAVSVTDAEAKIYKYLENEPFDWDVKSVSETAILKVVQ